MEHIKDWCISILDFVSIKNPAFRDFSEITKENLIRHYRDNNQKTYKGFQQGYRDINEMANSLSSLDLKELNILLQKRFGKDLLSANKKDVKSKIEKILRKGKISNASEYELLLARVEEIYSDEGKKDEVERLNALLTDYHK